MIYAPLLLLGLISLISRFRVNYWGLLPINNWVNQFIYNNLR